MKLILPLIVSLLTTSTFANVSDVGEDPSNLSACERRAFGKASQDFVEYLGFNLLKADEVELLDISDASSGEAMSGGVYRIVLGLRKGKYREEAVYGVSVDRTGNRDCQVTNVTLVDTQKTKLK